MSAEEAALRSLEAATARSEAARHVAAADALLGAAETRDRALVRELTEVADALDERRAQWDPIGPHRYVRGTAADPKPGELLRRAAATIDRLLAVQAKLAGGA